VGDSAKPTKRLGFFEQYLTLWVFLCMVVGVSIGKLLPGLTGAIRKLEFVEGSQINAAIAILIWLMVYPMMLRIDFTSIAGVRKKPKGLCVTLFVNWLVKPFSMAFLGWLFFKHVFSGLIPPAVADQYIAGTIILAAAPCTAMVFVWSYLRSHEDPEGAPLHRGARSAHRRQQLLRAGGRDRHRPLRPGLRRGARDGRRCARGGSGDAVGLPDVCRDAALV